MGGLPLLYSVEEIADNIISGDKEALRPSSSTELITEMTSDNIIICWNKRDNRVNIVNNAP